MKPLNYIIVKVKGTYNNDKQGVIVNSTIESVSNINREVEVHKAPEGIVVKEGDVVIIHHNILRYRNNMKGVMVNSNYYLGHEEDHLLFYVPLDLVFMYKKRGEDWKALSPFCFIKPVKKEEVDNVLLREEDSFDHKGNLRHHGTISHINEELLSWGLKKGDTIIFSTWGEYEFEIDGEIVYKMSTKDILAKV